MSYWDLLPLELQERIMKEAVQLIYNGLVKHFDTICLSLDARLLAHNYARPPNTERYRCRTSVYCQTYDRLHTPNFYHRIDNKYEPYTEYQINYTKTFGNKKIDNVVYESRGMGEHRQHNDPSHLPLYFVIKRLTEHAEITIDHLHQLLRLNNVKFKKSLRKPELVRLFLKI